MKTITSIKKAIKETNFKAVILDKATLNDVDELNSSREEDDFDMPSQESYTYWIEVESKQEGEKISTVVLQSAEFEEIEDAVDWLLSLQYTNPYDYHFYLVINYEGADCVNAVEFVPKQ